ncbi:hypothetical protein [Paenibacillus sp. IHBB 3054]|uniref:hypothetical protein n=1 Tax=Paenibacillus sp. IHBB 3054 TaxID=3425689 RepID=UPI003F664D46
MKISTKTHVFILISIFLLVLISSVNFYYVNSMEDDSNLNTILSTSMKAKLISSLLLVVSVVLLGVVAKLVMGMISKDEIGKMTNSIDSLVVTTGERIQHIKGIVLALSENSEVLTQAAKQSVTTIKEMSGQIREINEGTVAQAHGAKEMNHTMELMALNIGRIAGSANKLAEASLHSEKNAVAGQDHVSKAL